MFALSILDRHYKEKLTLPEAKALLRMCIDEVRLYVAIISDSSVGPEAACGADASVQGAGGGRHGHL
jgi:hypothetical protein